MIQAVIICMIAVFVLGFHFGQKMKLRIYEDYIKYLERNIKESHVADALTGRGPHGKESIL